MVLSVVYATWECVLVKRSLPQKPVFPIRLMKGRLFAGDICDYVYGRGSIHDDPLQPPIEGQAVDVKRLLEAGI